MFEKDLWNSVLLSKESGLTCIFTENDTLPQVFFKHFGSKNQLSGFYKSQALIENELNKPHTYSESRQTSKCQTLQ